MAVDGGHPLTGEIKLVSLLTTSDCFIKRDKHTQARTHGWMDIEINITTRYS